MPATGVLCPAGTGELPGVRTPLSSSHPSVFLLEAVCVLLALRSRAAFPRPTVSRGFLPAQFVVLDGMTLGGCSQSSCSLSLPARGSSILALSQHRGKAEPSTALTQGAGFRYPQANPVTMRATFPTASPSYSFYIMAPFFLINPLLQSLLSSLPPAFCFPSPDLAQNLS